MIIDPRILLDYSFAQIDIDNYIPGFIADRKQSLKYYLSEKYCEMNLSCINSMSMKLYDEYFNRYESHIDIKKGFSTFHFLGVVLSDLARNKPLKSSQLNTIYILHKKFEIFKRIFVYYDHNVRKTGDNFKQPQIYALFSIILELLFIREGNYNYLNTSIKLNDLIVKSKYDCNKKYYDLIYFSFKLEQLIFDDISAA